MLGRQASAFRPDGPYPSSIRFLGLGKVADRPVDTRHHLWQLSDLSDSVRNGTAAQLARLKPQPAFNTGI